MLNSPEIYQPSVIGLLKMIKSAREYCERMLTITRCSQLPFHNIDHTREVAANVRTIGNKLNLSAEELEPVLIAAWFHDTGFSQVNKGHEEVSMQLAKSFLEENDYLYFKTDIVLSCIMATKMPQTPLNKYAKILCDADVFHISNCDFFYRKLLLRREWEVELGKFCTDLEWHLLNLAFLQQHHFFTSYGKIELVKGKLENEDKVKKLISLYQ